MNDSAEPPPPSDTAAMSSGENGDDRSKSRTTTIDDEPTGRTAAAAPAFPASAASTSVPPGDTATAITATTTTTTSMTTVEPECRGQRSSIRGTTSPVIRAATSYPTTTPPSPLLTPMPQQPPLPPPGCGCIAAAVDKDEITVNITPTTGGQFELTVDRNDTVENLKKIISKKLKVVKERICLLHRER